MNLAFRDAVVEAFNDLGGVPALVKWGRLHPTEFYKIAARLIPTENEHSGAVTLQVITGVPSSDVWPPKSST